MSGRERTGGFLPPPGVPLTFPLTGADFPPPEGGPLTYPLTLAKPDLDPFFESFLNHFSIYLTIFDHFLQFSGHFYSF